MKRSANTLGSHTKAMTLETPLRCSCSDVGGTTDLECVRSSAGSGAGRAGHTVLGQVSKTGDTQRRCIQKRRFPGYLRAPSGIKNPVTASKNTAKTGVLLALQAGYPQFDLRSCDRSLQSTTGLFSFTSSLTDIEVSWSDV